MMGDEFKKQIELAVFAAMKEGTQLIEKIVDDNDQNMPLVSLKDCEEKLK
jgi:hypothetical protein